MCIHGIISEGELPPCGARAGSGQVLLPGTSRAYLDEVRERILQVAEVAA